MATAAYHISSQSQDFQPSQYTQTQATQAATQPISTPLGTGFPAHLWGILVSCAVGGSLSSIPAGGNTVGGGDRPIVIELHRDQKVYTVGRHPGSGVVLDGKKISGRHAKIFLSEEEDGEGVVRLEDLSTNGTFVRGVKIGKGNVTILTPGDEIIFGPFSTEFNADFRYIYQAPPPPSSSEPWGIRQSSGGGIHALYEVREQIGKGSFATVRKGVQRSTGKLMAIKIIQKARFAANPKTMEMIQREVEIMKKLDHQFCVRYIDYFEDDQRMWLVMEYVDGGDLLDYVMKRQGLNESETREIALMICQAVAYLHSKGVAHRDLKPENLLLSRGSRPLCKVTDFGLAKMVDNNTMLRTQCGTPTYLAPEVILNTTPQAGYGTAVDSWSIGVVLYSCLTNSTPFDESESVALPERMRTRVVDFAAVREMGISEVAIDFLRQLLLIDPVQRMSIKDALKHPWLATTIVNGTSTPALPLLVSSLPFNAGIEAVVGTPSVTSPGASMNDSFIYSQRLDNLRLESNRSLPAPPAPLAPPSPNSNSQTPLRPSTVTAIPKTEGTATGGGGKKVLARSAFSDDSSFENLRSGTGAMEVDSSLIMPSPREVLRPEESKEEVKEDDEDGMEQELLDLAAEHEGQAPLPLPVKPTVDTSPPLPRSSRSRRTPASPKVSPIISPTTRRKSPKVVRKAMDSPSTEVGMQTRRAKAARLS